MIRSLLAALVVPCLALQVEAAEPTVFSLWPESAPIEGPRPEIHLHLPEGGVTSGTVVVICPGGGYRGVVMSYEGHDVARWWNERGAAALVLRYRVFPHAHQPAPLQDASRAIRWARAHAGQYGWKADRIGVMGFSAGGHLAGSAAVLSLPAQADHADALERLDSRPDFAVLVYPVISMQDGVTHQGSRRNLLGEQPTQDEMDAWSLEKQVKPGLPPFFLLHTSTDTVVLPENSVRLYQALVKHQVPAELHIYRGGPHGVGLDRNPLTARWPESLDTWARHLGFLPKAP